ncbi:MAG: hypothetical protein IPN86_22515 [Saprospiraceae bacterium]|jgi:hypothetical protein|nr:hypothetical protein [Saprospiraceae bacterium]
MHDIEPWWGWRDEYVAEKDRKSPFYGKDYDEFKFTNKIYNYYIHPQWDYFGSETLYIKILYVNYKNHYALIELIGEWNDAIYNDIMFLKRDLIDILSKNNIYKFIIFCDNVLNYHGDDDCYYEEWYDDIKDDIGWVCLVNTFDHVAAEMQRYSLQYYLNYGPQYNDINWRTQKPAFIVETIENIMNHQQKQLL